MELLDLILNFVQGKIPGIFCFLRAVNQIVIGSVADVLSLEKNVLFIAGIVVAVVCGVLAYRFVKIFLALVAADFGFFIGVQLYLAVQTETMPNWVAYIFGLVLAIIFFWLAFGRASYVWYVIVALLGYCATRFYLVDNLWVALGGAFLLAMLSIAFFRIIYIAFTSLGCSVIITSFLSALLPDCKPLNLQPKNAIFWLIVLGLSILFILAQFLINCLRKSKRKKNKKKG